VLATTASPAKTKQIYNSNTRKKPKGGVLIVVEKVANRCLARIRILVEHLYAKIKVFKIVAYRYRNRRKRFRLRMAL